MTSCFVYRFLDMTFEDPTLLATQHMFGTGLTRYRQLDAAYKGDPVVPWRVVVRAKARALVEMEGASVGREDTHGSDGYGHDETTQKRPRGVAGAVVAPRVAVAGSHG
jgi:hypothetical protein